MIVELYSLSSIWNNNPIIKRGADILEVSVDQDLCISCGLCVSSCPDIFHWNKAEKADAADKKVNEDLEDCVQDAADGCPTDAIETQ